VGRRTTTRREHPSYPSNNYRLLIFAANRLAIGLFGLIGASGVFTSPLAGRFVDRLVPWHATLVGILGYMVFQAIHVGAGGIHVAAIVVACIGLDLFEQLQQVSLTTAVFALDEAARARLNAVLILSIFIGQVMGMPSGAFS
jgi:hypothetical protein